MKETESSEKQPFGKKNRQGEILIILGERVSRKGKQCSGWYEQMIKFVSFTLLEKQESVHIGPKWVKTVLSVEIFN